jgi:uncharacterized protein
VTLVIDVRDLLRQAGSARTVDLHEPMEGLATELARVPEGRAVRARLLLESVVEGILVSGPISGAMDVDCARCLKPVDAGFQVEVQELFVAGETAGDDEYTLLEDEIDLEPMIRDAILLAMPFSPLCRPDCLGLCERCGGDRNLDECACGPVVNERWAALSSVSFPHGPAGTGPSR